MGNATLRANAAAAGIPANLLRRQPRPAGRRDHHHQRRQFQVRLDADRAAAPLLRRPAVRTSYVFGKGYQTELGDLAPRAAVDPRCRHPGRRHPPVQGERRLRPAVRPAASKWGANANGFVDRLIGGWQVGLSARVQTGRLIDLGNVRIDGHVDGRGAGHVQAALRRSRPQGVDDAAGRDRPDDQRVQRQRHVADRLRRRRAERPLLRAGQRPGLHRGGQRRRLRRVRRAGRSW